MSLKLTVLLVVIALTGQGLAWPKTFGDEPNNKNSIYEAAVSVSGNSAGQSVTESIKNCLTTGAQILKTLAKQVVLTVRSITGKVSLLFKVVGCFFTSKDAAGTYECGNWLYVKYWDDARQLDQEQKSSMQDLSKVLTALPTCYRA